MILRVIPFCILNLAPRIPVLMSLLFRNLRIHQVFGANTDVGKTLLTSALVRASANTGQVYYLKPVSTGYLQDADDESVFTIRLFSTHLRTLGTSSDSPDPMLQTSKRDACSGLTNLSVPILQLFDPLSRYFILFTICATFSPYSFVYSQIFPRTHSSSMLWPVI